MFAPSAFRSLQRDMNDLFSSFYSTPSLFTTTYDPFYGYDHLRNSLVSLFDEFPYRATVYFEDSPQMQLEDRPAPSAAAPAPAPASTSTAIPINGPDAAETPAPTAAPAPSTPETEKTDMVHQAQEQPKSVVRTLGKRFRNWLPRCDVEEKENEIVIHAELPGVPKEETKLEIDPVRSTLTISGSRKYEREEGAPSSTFHRVECQQGSFQRTFRLPEACRGRLGEIAAKAENGIIEIHCPKAPEPEKPKPFAVAIN